MPSEKAKENKTLVVVCVACGKSVSAEIAQGTVVGRGNKRVTVTVCDVCRQKGWKPEPAAAS